MLRGRLTAEDGARLVQAIQAAESCAAGTSAGQRAADGLVALAVAYLGDPSGRDVTITVEVDAAVTPPATLERLLCDASVQIVSRDDPDGQKLCDPVRLRGNAADIDNPAITPDTIRSLWQGEPLDLATAVEVLLWRRHHNQPPPHELQNTH